MEVRGRDLVTGLPHTITLCSEEVEEALRESAYIIVHTAKSVLGTNTTRIISRYRW